MLYMELMNWNHECMELQQMRYAVAVAEERSFTRAAERCYVVQSALSHQIKALERELGVTLFARSSRRVEPTAAGEAFVASARSCLDLVERAAVDAAAAAGVIRGRLTIGMIPTVTSIDIGAVLAEFTAAYPSVHVRMHSGGSDRFISRIAAGTMDVAVLGLPSSHPPEAVASHCMRQDRLVAVVGDEHRFAGRKRLMLRDLEDEVFVDFPPGTPGRTQSDLAFTEAGIGRRVMFEAMTTDLIVDLVAQGLAVGMLPAAAVEKRPGLHLIEVRDGPSRTEYIAWSDFNPSPAAQAFLTLVGIDAQDT